MTHKSLSGFHYEQVTAHDEVKTLTKLQADEVFITLWGGEIRYRFDSGDPTALMGHLLYGGDSLRLDNIGKIEKFRFIKASDRPSILSVTYEKE